MPKKMKTHRGAAKRFSLTKNKKVRCRRAYRNHILTKKTNKKKRQLRAQGIVSKSDTPAVLRMLLVL